MEFVFNNGNDKEYQRGLNVLLTKVFQDFSFWMDQDLWDERYESYAIVEDGRFVSNICVFRTQVLWRGEPHLALSLGAVCTDPDYRGRGYSRMLMDRVLERYPHTPMYLSANPSVVEFYPKFGFQRVYEKRPMLSCAIDNALPPKKLTYNDPKVYEYVRGRKNFSRLLDCANTETVAMFDLYQRPFVDSLYEVPECKAMVVAEQQGDVLTLYGVYALRNLAWDELQARLPFAGVRRVEFGFMPDGLGVPYAMEEFDGEIVFVRNLGVELGDFKFPDLSFT